MRNSDRLMQLINQTSGETILSRLEAAGGFWKRLIGLMGRADIPDDYGLYLSPCSSIHCFFMRFPIDVVFINRDHVVVAVYPSLMPWKVALPGSGAYAAIEAGAGQLAHRVTPGDVLIMKEAVSETISS